MFKYQTRPNYIRSFFGYVILFGVLSTQIAYGQQYQQNAPNSYPQNAQTQGAYQHNAHSYNAHSQNATQQKPKFSDRVKSFLGIGEEPTQNPHAHNHAHAQHGQHNAQSNVQHNAQPNVQHNAQHYHADSSGIGMNPAHVHSGQQYGAQNQNSALPHSPANTYINLNGTANPHNAGYNNIPGNTGVPYTSPAVPRRPQTTANSGNRTSGVSRETAFPVTNTTSPGNSSNQDNLASSSAMSDAAGLDRLNRMRGSIFEKTAKEREMMLERKEARLTVDNSFGPSNNTISSKVGTSSTRRSATTTIDIDVDSIPDEPLSAKNRGMKETDPKVAASRNVGSQSSNSRSSAAKSTSRARSTKIALPTVLPPADSGDDWNDSADDGFADHEVSTDDEIRSEPRSTLPKLGANRTFATGKSTPQRKSTSRSVDGEIVDNRVADDAAEETTTVSTPKTSLRRVAVPTELSRSKEPLLASRQRASLLPEAAELTKDEVSENEVSKTQILSTQNDLTPEEQTSVFSEYDSPKDNSIDVSQEDSQSPSIPLNASKESSSENRPKILSKTVYPPDYSHKEANIAEGLAQQQDAASSTNRETPSQEKNTANRQNNLVSNIALIEVEMTGPKKRVVGQESLYQFKIVNRGGIAAEQVVLSVEMPVWAEVQSVDTKIGATSFANLNEETHVLNWNIDRLEAGEKNAQLLAIHLVPRQRKTLTMSWDYNFKQPIGQTMIDVLEPKIEMSIEGPFEMLWGTEEEFRLRIQNTGNGDVEDLHLIFQMSDSLPNDVKTHSMGTLKAGQEEILTLIAFANQQEKLDINVQANGPFGLQAETAREVKVLRSKLTSFVDAPEMQFVGNQNEYRITVQNTGTATAQDVEIKAWIPSGAKHVSNQRNGRVLPGLQNQVIWTVDAIPVGEEFVCSLVCEMRKEGVCKVDVTATEKSGLSAVASASTQVDSIADLVLRINNPQAPVEVGKISTHAIVVTNRGSRAAENVEIVAAFAEGVSPLETEGGKAKIDKQPTGELGGMVYFDTISSIGPNQSITLKIKARSSIAGKQKIRVEMACPDSDIHLVHEETTHYYSKQKSTVPQNNSGNPKTSVIQRSKNVFSEEEKTPEPIPSRTASGRIAPSPTKSSGLDSNTMSISGAEPGKRPTRGIPSLAEIEKRNQAAKARKPQSVSPLASRSQNAETTELPDLPPLPDFDLDESMELKLNDDHFTNSDSDADFELFSPDEL